MVLDGLEYNMSFLPEQFVENKTPVSVKDFGAKGDGTTDDTVAINNAFSASDDVYYPSGTYKINTNTSLGTSGQVHHFARDAKIHVLTGVTLTINGDIQADMGQNCMQIDSGSTVTHTPDSGPVSAYWYGAVGNANPNTSGTGTDSTIGFQTALNAAGQLAGRTGTVYLPGGNYRITSTLNIPGGVSIIGDGNYGNEIGASIQYEGANSTNCFEIRSTPNTASSNRLDTLFIGRTLGFGGNAIYIQAWIDGIITRRPSNILFNNIVSFCQNPALGVNTTISSGSDGVVLVNGSISDVQVASTSGMLTSGSFNVVTNVGTATIQYTGLGTSPTRFTGCTTNISALPSSPTINTGSIVSNPYRFDRGLYMDGSLLDVAGARGIRATNFYKCRFGDCILANEYAHLSQVTHLTAVYLEIDGGPTAFDTSVVGMTIDKGTGTESADVYLYGLEVNGNLLLSDACRSMKLSGSIAGDLVIASSVSNADLNLDVDGNVEIDVNATGSLIGTWAGNVGTTFTDNTAGINFITLMSGAPVSLNNTNSLHFNVNAVPLLNQPDDTTASGTASSFTIKAQNETGATSIGGSVILVPGTGTSTYGTVKLGSSTSTTGLLNFQNPNAHYSSNLITMRNNANNADRLIIYTDSGDDIVFGDPSSPGSTYLDGGVAGSIFRVNGSSAKQTSYTGAVWSFNTLVSGPTWKQDDTTVNSATGQSLTIQAQNATGATSTGGNIILQSGSGTSTNGTVQLKAGTNALVTFSYLSGLTELHSDSSSGLYIVAAGQIIIDTPLFTLRDLSLSSVITCTLASGGASSIVVSTGVTSFALSQADKTTNSGVGATFTIQSQNETGTASTGGDLILQTGTGTSTAGTLRQKIGATEFFFANSGAVLYKTPLFYMQDNLAQDAIIFGLAGTGATVMVFGNGVTVPTIGHYTLVGTGAHNGVALSIQAQGGQAQTGGNANTNGGNLTLSSGPAGTGGSGAAGVDGSVNIKTNTTTQFTVATTVISLFTGAGDGTGNKVLSIHNATTDPTTNPSNGGILYCSGGALLYRGSNGTITTLGNA